MPQPASNLYAAPVSGWPPLGWRCRAGRAPRHCRQPSRATSCPASASEGLLLAPALPPRLTQQLAESRASWLQSCVEAPLLDGSAHSRVHVLGLCHYAPLGGQTGLEALRQVRQPAHGLRCCARVAGLWAAAAQLGPRGTLLRRTVGRGLSAAGPCHPQHHQQHMLQVPQAMHSFAACTHRRWCGQSNPILWPSSYRTTSQHEPVRLLNRSHIYGHGALAVSVCPASLPRCALGLSVPETIHCLAHRLQVGRPGVGAWAVRLCQTRKLSGDRSLCGGALWLGPLHCPFPLPATGHHQRTLLLVGLNACASSAGWHGDH